MHAYALTDVGSTREHNEDAFLVAALPDGHPLRFDEPETLRLPVGPGGMLFMVADGMGGAASGELASAMAVEAVFDAIRAATPDGAPFGPEAFASALRDATIAANARIHRHAREHREHRGMGTTATVVGLLGDHLFLAQVGDSRAYLVRDGRAIQLTRDQSLIQRLVDAGELSAEEAETSQRRNIILQALGPDAEVIVDLTHQPVRHGDALVLCSDGLSGLVRAEEIGLLAADIEDPAALCHELVARANARGGPDNITVIVARLSGDGLAPTVDDDEVGYRSYPLAGEAGVAGRAPGTPLRSDPTPPFGTPVPPAAAAAIPPGPAAPSVPSPPSAVPILPAGHGAGSGAGPDRRQRARLLSALLAMIAVAVAGWTLWQWLAGDG